MATDFNWLDMFVEDDEETTTDVDFNDIVPSDDEEESTSLADEMLIDDEEESTNTTSDDEEEPTSNETTDNVSTDVSDLLSETESIINTAEESKEDIKSSIEEVQEAISSWDSEEATKLINTLYEQILIHEAELERSKTKYDVLKSNFDSMNQELQNTKLQLDTNNVTTISNDPQMKILNRMYDDAMSGKDTAKNKVTSLLEDMYYKVTWESLEDKILDKSISDSWLNKNYTEPTSYEEVDDEDNQELSEWILWIY